MRRQDKASADSVVIRVRDICGTYIATGGGKRTSCTAGALSAVHAHCAKLFSGRVLTIAALREPNTWRAMAEKQEASR